MKETKEKSKALNLAIEKLEKTYGQGTIMKLSDENIVKIPSIPTGSLSLDIALGIGGLPQGRVVEIFGPESSGKTTLSMHCIAEAQKKGGIAAFIDAEHAFDKTYAEKLGIDTENLLISQPDNGEQALEITEHLIRSNAIDIIVIDSVAALVPKGEIEGEMGDSMMGLQARLMSQALSSQLLTAPGRSWYSWQFLEATPDSSWKFLAVRSLQLLASPGNVVTDIAGNDDSKEKDTHVGFSAPSNFFFNGL